MIIITHSLFKPLLLKGYGKLNASISRYLIAKLYTTIEFSDFFDTELIQHECVLKFGEGLTFKITPHAIV